MDTTQNSSWIWLYDAKTTRKCKNFKSQVGTYFTLVKWLGDPFSHAFSGSARICLPHGGTFWIVSKHKPGFWSGVRPTSRFCSSSTPIISVYNQFLRLKIVLHGFLRCPHCENATCKTILLSVSEIFGFRQIVSAQTITESKNWTYFLATFILKLQNHTTFNCVKSKRSIRFFQKKFS